MFNMFNYLKMKGFEIEELVEHFDKIDEVNNNINRVLAENPGAILKSIEIHRLDEKDKKLQFDINIEVYPK